MPMESPSSNGGASKCIEWCHDYVDGDRFADQGYLDSFAGRSARVAVIENPGANLAPWNIGNYRIDLRAGKVTIDATYPLIFFHFQGVKRGLRWFVFNSHRVFRAPFSAAIRKGIYAPYVNELLAIEREVDPVLRVSDATPHGRAVAVDILRRLINAVRNLRLRALQLLDIVTGRAFFVLDGTVH